MAVRLCGLGLYEEALPLLVCKATSAQYGFENTAISDRLITNQNDSLPAQGAMFLNALIIDDFNGPALLLLLLSPNMTSPIYGAVSQSIFGSHFYYVRTKDSTSKKGQIEPCKLNSKYTSMKESYKTTQAQNMLH